MTTTNAGLAGPALRNAILIGTALQTAMVLSGHWVQFIKMNVFAIGGMAISLVAGLLYARAARVTPGRAALNSAIAGGGCALIGIAISYLLGDVPAAVLAFGTASSAVSGAIGGVIGGGASPAAAAVLLLVLASTSALAQQTAGTGALPAGHRAATTADLAWLAGTWDGRGAASNTATAEVTFTAPRAGLVLGVMRLMDQNRIVVVELITIVDTPNGPEMRFQHFSSALEAYETEFRQTIRLTAHTADREVFDNQVDFDARLMSTRPRVTTFIRHGVDEFVGHSDILDEHGQPGVVEMTYHRRIR